MHLHLIRRPRFSEFLSMSRLVRPTLKDEIVECGPFVAAGPPRQNCNAPRARLREIPRFEPRTG